MELKRVRFFLLLSGPHRHNQALQSNFDGDFLAILPVEMHSAPQTSKKQEASKHASKQANKQANGAVRSSAG